MATLVAHAAIPLVTRRLVTVPGHLERRLTVAALLLACWQDVDYVTLAFEVRPNELLGHRGLTHGLVTAAILALVTSFVAFRALRGTRAFWIVAGFLFAMGASHGLLDAMTAGDIGVALLAPLSNARFSFPFKLIASCPGGIDELVGYWGILTVANELLYVVLPLAIAVTLIRFPERARRLGLMAVLWAACVVLLRTTRPLDFTPTVTRILMPSNAPHLGSYEEIPTNGLPDGKLVTRLEDLRALGLFDRHLTPRGSEVWSSSFFPSWFGGEGGRWQDAAPTLVWRTLAGFHPVSEAQARAWLDAADIGDAAASQALFRLSPLEKLDLALGRFDFPAEKQSLALAHNARPRPRYWAGRCNGVAAAALAEPEPFRVVDVVTQSGAHVRFHPNDVKALLAMAYDEPKTMTVIGDWCDTLAFDAPATCNMSPAVFVVAALNRIGLAGESFLIDALPTLAKQYYAVADVLAHVVRERPVDDTPASPWLAGKIASLADVEIELVVSSTTLRYARANVLDPKSADGTRYRKVGLVPVRMKYEATLALDASSDILGGRWTGDPPDGPDDIIIVAGGPKLTPEGNASRSDAVPWWFVQALAHASVDDTASIPTVDLRK